MTSNIKALVILVGLFLFVVVGVQVHYFKDSISNVELETFTRWSKTFEHNTVIMHTIKEAIKDDFISVGEYRDVLTLVVEENERALEFRREQRLDQIKNNTRGIK